MDPKQQVDLAQATLDQQWATMETLIDTYEAIVGVAHKQSLITNALHLIVLEVRTRQARRALVE